MIKSSVLKNGLQIVLLPLPQFQSTTLTLQILAGSRFEKENQKGAAHLLEHLALKGTPSFKDKLTIAKFLDELGARFSASTGKELVEFYLKFGDAASNLERAFSFMREVVFEPLLAMESLAIEKKVIQNEINADLDKPARIIHRALSKLIWPNQRLGEDVAGGLTDLEKITEEDLFSYHQQFFKPSRMVLGLAGNFDEEKVLSLIQCLENYQDSPQKSKEIVPQSSFGGMTWIARPHDKETRFLLGFPGASFNEKKYYSLILLSTILGGGRGSRLFQLIREKYGLVYDIGSFLKEYSDTGVFGISGEVAEENLLKVTELIMEELGKIQKDKPFTKEELDLVKRKVKGRLALGLETPASLLNWYTPQFLLSKEIESFEDFCGRIDNVTEFDLQKTAQETFFQSQPTFVFTSVKDYTAELSLRLGINGVSQESKIYPAS